MHRTRGIRSAVIFLADIVNIFSAVFLDRLGKKHRSIAVTTINQSGKGLNGICCPLWCTAFVRLESFLCLLPQFRRNYSLMLGIINFTLIAKFANINRIGDHIPQHCQIDGIAAVSVARDPGAMAISNAGYGGHFRAVQGFRYVGKEGEVC